MIPEIAEVPKPARDPTGETLVRIRKEELWAQRDRKTELRH